MLLAVIASLVINKTTRQNVGECMTRILEVTHTKTDYSFYIISFLTATTVRGYVRCSNVFGDPSEGLIRSPRRRCIHCATVASSPSGLLSSCSVYLLVAPSPLCCSPLWMLIVNEQWSYVAMISDLMWMLDQIWHAFTGGPGFLRCCLYLRRLRPCLQAS